MGGVLDHRETMPRGHGHHRIEIAWMSGEVDWDEGLGPRADGRLHRRGIDVQGVELDVGKDRTRGPVYDDVGR